ncbi:MAG: hypothetical protein AAGG01_21545, partial [Planctomycetota bacterium]
AEIEVPSADDGGSDSGSWGFDEEEAHLQTYGGERVLLVEASMNAVVVEIPVPEGAAGAGQVAVRVMSDGDFRMTLTLGNLKGAPVPVGNSRRRWREVLFPLTRPLSFSSGERLRLQLESLAVPVVLQAVRFMP